MICGYCGHSNEYGVKFCGKCGALVPEMPAAPAAPVAPVVPAAPVAPVAPAAPVVPAFAENPNINAPAQGGFPNPMGVPQVGAPTPVEFQNLNQGGFPNANPVGVPTPVGVNNIAPSAAGVATVRAKKLPLKKILAIAIPVVAIAVALAIVIPLLQTPNISVQKDFIMAFGDDDVAFISGNNNKLFELEGEFHSQQDSLDGAKAAILTDYSYSYSDGYGGILWHVTTTGADEVAENVMGYRIADSGDGIAYLTSTGSYGDNAELYLFDASSKKSTLITEEARGDIDSVCISPDGKTVGYMSDYNSDSREWSGYVKSGSKAAEKLGVEVYALAVSDGGKYTYIVKNNTLRVKSGNNEETLSDGTRGLMLNKDYSQAIFRRDSKAFISRKGGERQEISKSTITDLILPRDGQQTSYNGVSVYGVGSFANTVAECYDGVLFINGKFETHRVLNSATYSSSNGEPKLSSDGKTLVFVRSNGSLSRINPTNPNAERRDFEGTESVRDFVMTGDGNNVYYINYSSELYYVKGNGRPTKVDDDVSGEYLALSYNSNKLFYLKDVRYSNGHDKGELFFSNGGKKGTRIADEVLVVNAVPTSIFYVNADFELHRSNGNEKFTKVHEFSDGYGRDGRYEYY